MELFLKGINYDNNKHKVLNIDDNNNIKIDSTVAQKMLDIYNQTLIIKNFRLFNDIRYQRNQGNCYSLSTNDYTSNINNITNHILQIFNDNVNYTVYLYFVNFTISNSTDAQYKTGLRIIKTSTKTTNYNETTAVNFSNLKLNGNNIPSNIIATNKTTNITTDTNDNINGTLYSKFINTNNAWTIFDKINDIKFQDEFIEIPSGYGLNFNIFNSSYVYYSINAKILVLPSNIKFPKTKFLE